jgi:hypothetical protein
MQLRQPTYGNHRFETPRSIGSLSSVRASQHARAPLI